MNDLPSPATLAATALIDGDRFAAKETP